VRLAARGSCLYNTTIEHIDQVELRDALRRQAQGIHLKSLGLAIVFTALVYLINS